jgi:predicted RNase H-like HicB family nuclease
MLASRELAIGPEDGSHLPDHRTKAHGRTGRGTVDVSETYTAVYVRDGDGWAVTIAEEPRVNGRGQTPAAARQQIRDALAACLTTDPEDLRIVDRFGMPAEIRATQDDVKATRSEADRSRMLSSMTEPRSAVEWAKELGIADRDPKTVEWLQSLEGQTIEIDHLCSTITMAEDMSRFHGGGADRVPSPEGSDEG